MDNNLNSSQPNTAPAATTPSMAAAPNPTVNPAPSAPQPANTPPQNTEGGSKKMILWLVLGLVVIILLVGGIYYFLSGNQKKPQETASTQTPAPVSKAVEDVNESDVEGVSLDNLDTEFQSVDSDLKSL